MTLLYNLYYNILLLILENGDIVYKSI